MAKVVIKEVNGKELITVEQEEKSILRFLPEVDTRESLLATANKIAATGFTKFEDDGLEYVKSNNGNNK